MQLKLLRSQTHTNVHIHIKVKEKKFFFVVKQNSIKLKKYLEKGLR